MKIKNTHLISAILLTVFSLLVYYAALDYPPSLEGAEPGPAFFPKIIAVSLIILALGLIITGYNDKSTEPKSKIRNFDSLLIKRVSIVLITVVFILIIPFAGFMISSMLYIFTFMKIVKTKGYLIPIFISVAVSIILTYTFKEFLYVQLP